MLFTFLYSPRVGTAAASMPDPYSRENKQKRFDRLLELQGSLSQASQAAHIGKTHRILIDGEGDIEGRLTARTSCGRLVHINGGKELIGTFHNALITDSTTWSLTGRLTEGDRGYGGRHANDEPVSKNQGRDTGLYIVFPPR
jgi:tRNA-2-methylthio-N6-dimethylallyladenosine synthase